MGEKDYQQFFLVRKFIERKYMTNRRRLIKAIKNGTVKVVKKPTPDPDYFSDIEMYDINYVSGDTYDLWLWTRKDGVVKATVGDNIGLFTGSLTARFFEKLLQYPRYISYLIMIIVSTFNRFFRKIYILHLIYNKNKK